MQSKARIRRIITILGLLITVSLAGATLTTPAYAKVVTTCRSLCFTVDGSGNHINRVGVSINVDQSFIVTDYGHIQARWHAGGVDHFRNSPQFGISNQGTAWLSMNVNVDPYTYVCGRFWRWNGSSWILPYGDWQCIKTHP